MATNGRTQTQSVEGVVEATNATGLKIGGAWLNVSRYKPVELPDVGAHVRVQVDDRGYIKTLDVLEAPYTPTSATVNRDRTISRLTVLKAAAHFGASRPDLTSAQVLRIADSWLAWLNRED